MRSAATPKPNPTGGRGCRLIGQIRTAAQCQELLTQLGSSRLFLALHDPDGKLRAVASPAQLRRAARRRHRRGRARTDRICNLCCYCRTHHRLKHQAPGWTRQFEPDATMTITTPTGNTRSTRPPGPEPDWPAPAEANLPKPPTSPATHKHDPPPF